jgi:hypothetical protein
VQQPNRPSAPIDDEMRSASSAACGTRHLASVEAAAPFIGLHVRTRNRQLVAAA